MFNFLCVSAKYTYKGKIFGPLESIQANFWYNTYESSHNFIGFHEHFHKLSQNQCELIGLSAKSSCHLKTMYECVVIGCVFKFMV